MTKSENVSLNEMQTNSKATYADSDNNNYHLSQSVKINYGIGDLGNNIVWQMLMVWAALFYTDVYGLDPIHAGTMFLVVRVFDAVTDPLVGFMVDRTRTEHGSSRPYILYGTVPLAISYVMVFYTPDLGSTGKLIYAYLSFSLLSLTYTFVNVPFSSMAGFLTRDSDERTSLQSYRFGLGMFASVIVSISVVRMVEFFGGGDVQKGYFYTAIVFGVCIIACLYYCAFTVKERYQPPKLTEKDGHGLSDFLNDVKTAFRNDQLIILLSVNVIFFITLTLKGYAGNYFVIHVLNAEDYLTTFLTWGSVGTVFGAALSAFLWTRFDKLHAYKVLMFVCGILTAIPYWLPTTAFTLILIINVVLAFLQLTMVPLTWSMLSDLVDYQRTLNKKNMSGVFFALFLFILKLGLGLGSAIAMWVIGYTGYTAGADQQLPEVVESIKFISTLLPAVLFLIAGFIMLAYKLDKTRRAEIFIKLYEH